MAKTENVRRDRVGVLASTIVKELASARLRDIERESITPPEPPVVVSAPMKRLLERYIAAKKAKAAASDALQRLGYHFGNDYGDNLKVTIERPHVGHRAKEDEAKKHRAVRMNQVRELRTEALIDLVTLEPAKAKDAVKAFRARIEAV